MNGFLRKIVLLPILIAFCLVTLALPNPAQAKWDDKSDELDGGGSTGLVVAVVVVAAAALVYILVKSGGDDDEEPAEDQSSITEEETLAPVSLRMEQAAPQPNLRLALGLPEGENGAVTLKGVRMGVSMEF